MSTAYQVAALCAALLRPWSTSTSESEVNAISSHSTMKVATLPALGTSSSVVTKIGNRHAAVRVARPWRRVPDAVQRGRYRHHGHEQHEERTQRIEHQVDAGKREQFRRPEHDGMPGDEHMDRRGRLERARPPDEYGCQSSPGIALEGRRRPRRRRDRPRRRRR